MSGTVPPPTFAAPAPGPAAAPAPPRLPRILCVDDEPRVLEAMERNLGDDFDVVTATSGPVALARLAADGPFAAIVCDMRMPEMAGSEVLAQAYQRAPEVTRLLLTGHADLSSATAAVNDGHVFRFLLKPCPADALRRHLVDAVEQHRLLTAERELLERTLTGAVELLTDLLGLTAPAVFSRSRRLRDAVAAAAARLGLANAWECELAALLCLIGCITLPHELIERAWAGVRLTPAERDSLEHHPQIGHKLLATIPRLERVAEIVRHQKGGALTGDAALDEAIVLLRAALDRDDMIIRGLTRAEIGDELLRRRHPLRIVAALVGEHHGAPPPVEALPLARLSPGVVLERDIVTPAGGVLVKAGMAVSPALLERLRKYAAGVGVVEPIFVRAA